MNFMANTASAQKNIAALEKRVAGLNSLQANNYIQLGLMSEGVKGFGDAQRTIDIEGPIRQMDRLTKGIKDNTLNLRESRKAWKEIGELQRYQISLNNASIASANSYGNAMGQVAMRIPEMGTLTSKISDQAVKLKTAGAAAEVYGRKLMDAGKNLAFMGRQSLLTVTMPATLIGGALAASFYGIDQQLTEIAKVYGGLETDFNASAESIREASRGLAEELNKNYAIAENETLDLISTFSRLGETGEDLDAMASAAARLMRLGDVDTQTASQMITTLRTAMRYTKEELDDAINMMNIFENTTTLSMNDFAEGFPRMAAVFETFGGSLKDAGIAMETFTSRGINAVEGANSLKTVAAKIARPTKQVRDLWEEMTEGVMGSFDDMAHGLDNNVLKILEHIYAVQEALGTSDVMRQRFFAQLGGAHQYSKLMGLASGLVSPTEGIEFIKGMSEDEFRVYAKETSDREINILLQSASAQFGQAWNRFKMWAEKVGQAILPIFTDLLNKITTVLEKASEMGKAIYDAIGPLGPVLKNIATVAALATASFGPLMLTAASGMMIYGGVRKQQGRVMKGLGSLFGTSLGRGKGQKEEFLTQEEMAQKLANQELSTIKPVDITASSDLRSSLNRTSESYQGVRRAATEAAAGIRKSTDAQISAARAFASSSRKINATLRRSSPLTTQAFSKEFGTLAEQEEDRRMLQEILSGNVKEPMRISDIETEEHYRQYVQQVQAKKNITNPGMYPDGSARAFDSKQATVIGNAFRRDYFNLQHKPAQRAAFDSVTETLDERKIRKAADAQANLMSVLTSGQEKFAKFAEMDQEAQKKRVEQISETWGRVGQRMSAVVGVAGMLTAAFGMNNKVANGVLSTIMLFASAGAISDKAFKKMGTGFAKNVLPQIQKFAPWLTEVVGNAVHKIKPILSNLGSLIGKAFLPAMGIGAAVTAGVFAFRLLTSESREFARQTEKIKKTVESYPDIFGYTALQFGQIKDEDGEVVDTKAAYVERLKNDENTGALISRLKDKADDLSSLRILLQQEAVKMYYSGAAPEDVKNGIEALLDASNISPVIKNKLSLEFQNVEYKLGSPNAVSIGMQAMLDDYIKNHTDSGRIASMGDQILRKASPSDLSKKFEGELQATNEAIVNTLKLFGQEGGEAGAESMHTLFDAIDGAFEENYMKFSAQTRSKLTPAGMLRMANDEYGTALVDAFKMPMMLQQYTDMGWIDDDTDQIKMHMQKMSAYSEALKQEFGGNKIADLFFDSGDRDLIRARVGEATGLITLSVEEALRSAKMYQASGLWNEFDEHQQAGLINTLRTSAGLRELEADQLAAAVAGRSFGIQIEEIAAALGVNADEVDGLQEAYDNMGSMGVASLEDFFKTVAELLGIDVEDVTKALERLSQTRLDPATGELVALGDAADEAEDKLIDLQNAMARGAKGDWSATFTIEFQTAGGPIPYEMTAEEAVSAYKDKMSKAWGDVLDEMAADSQIQIDAEKRAFRDRQQAETDAMQERQEAAKKALDAQQKAEKKSFDENWKRRIDDENKAYEDRIKAIEKTQEKEDDLERIRKRNSEREQRRLKYQQSLMQNGIEMTIALAGGDLDEAARLSAAAAARAADYGQEVADAEASYLKEDEDKARRDQIDLIKEEQKVRMESLEEQRRMEEEAMQERLERQREELAERQKAEQKFLSRKQEDQNIANEIQFQARKRALDRELAALRAHIPRNQAELEAATERVQVTYDDHGFRLIKKSDDWGVTIRDALESRTREATERMSDDAMWRSFGNRVAEGVSKGAFDMNAQEFANFLRTGDMPGMGSGGVMGAVRSAVGKINPFRHSGGPIGTIGSDKYNSRGNIPMNAPMRSDEQQVIAQHGEYMMNKKAHAKYGTDAMHAVNAGKALILRHEGGPIGTAGFGAMGGAIQAAMIGALISRAALAAGQAAQQASMFGFGGMGTGMMGDQPGGGSVRLGNISGPGITTPIQQAMWDTIRTNVPHSVLVSATRTVQTEGHPDNHNMGRAIDLVSDAPGGMQAIARWIAVNYPNSAELIHSPFNHNIKNGRNVGDGYAFYGAGQMAAHDNHVHWAMNGMTPPAEGGAMPGTIPSDEIRKKFPQYHSWTTPGIEKYKQNMAMLQMSKMGFSMDGSGSMYGSSVPMPFIAGNQQDYIRQIVGLAKARGMGPKAALIALMTAMQESNIRVLANPRVPASYNFPHDGVGTDHDSVGIFQQRPHWGPVSVLMNPAGSAGLFYNVLGRMNYDSMDPTVAAQKVQVSAYPEAYRKWQPQAQALVNQYYDEGGIAKGTGLMPKNVLSPERVLSPRQTAAFEELVPFLTEMSNMGIVDYDEAVYRIVRDVHLTDAQIRAAAVAATKTTADNAIGDINVTIRDATIVGVDELDRKLEEWGRKLKKQIAKEAEMKERRLRGR